MLQDSNAKVLVIECTDLSEITRVQNKWAAESWPPLPYLSLRY